jgi:hypothetical protein
VSNPRANPAVAFAVRQKLTRLPPRARASYSNSLAYNNYSLTTTAYSDWGWEIADHTMTHVGTPNSSEVLGNLKA